MDWSNLSGIELILLIVLGIIDTIIKGFIYGWIFLIPIMLIVIILIIKNKKIKKTNGNRSKKTSIIIFFLIGIFCAVTLTSRMWGPNFYKYIISFSICNKEKEIEEKLEKKYNKNFTFVSQDNIETDAYAGQGLGEDVYNDFLVKYRFKDDDGVFAIVEYKKNYSQDYYESKRSKYDIEKYVYDYAKKIGFNSNFYIFVKSSNVGSDLNKQVLDDFIDKKRVIDCVYFITTKSSDKDEEFIKSALNKFFNNTHLSINQYIVTEEKYNELVKIFNSEIVKNEIDTKEYEINVSSIFNEEDNTILDHKHYYM